MSSRQEASPFVVQMGITNFDNSASPETAFIAYPVTGDPVPPTIVRVRDDDMDESGRDTLYGEESGNTIYTEATYNLQVKGTAASIGHLAYWASNPSAAATSATHGTGGEYQSWTGGTNVASTALQHRSTTAEFLGLPGSDNGHHNLRLYNAIVEECSISGQRGGRIDVSASIRGGGEYENISGDPADASTHETWCGTGVTGPLMFSTDAWLISSDNTGYRATPGTFTPFVAAPTSATVLAKTWLAATATAGYMDDWMSFNLTFRKPVDVVQSLTPGGNAFVQHYDDWYVTSENVTLTLSFLDNSTAVKLLKTEYEAGTPRPWELYFQHPASADYGSDDAWPGAQFAFGKMQPIPGSYRKSASIDGPVMVSIDYRPLAVSNVAFRAVFSHLGTANTGAASANLGG